MVGRAEIILCVNTLCIFVWMPK